MTLQMGSLELVLGPGVEDAIRRHGTETYPNECCGALVGREGDVQHAVQLPNTTEEGPRRRFLVRPADYMQAKVPRGTWAETCSGFIIPIRMRRPGRRSTIWITRGRRSGTLSWQSNRGRRRP